MKYIILFLVFIVSWEWYSQDKVTMNHAIHKERKEFSTKQEAMKFYKEIKQVGGIDKLRLNKKEK